MLTITPSTTVKNLKGCEKTLSNAYVGYSINGKTYLKCKLGFTLGTINGNKSFRERIKSMILKNIKKENKTKTDDQLLKQFNKEVSLRRALKDITSIVSSNKNGQVSK